MARQPAPIPWEQPRLPEKYEERLEYRHWVTPQSLSAAPIHRWFVFPHSFGRELVWKLIDEWGIGPEDHILDPFVGAGTTLLAAKERGIPATGVDLSPFAAFVSHAKLADYETEDLLQAHKKIISRFMKNPSQVVPEGDPFLRKCFPPEVYQGLMALKTAILAETNEKVRDFSYWGCLPY